MSDIGAWYGTRWLVAPIVYTTAAEIYVGTVAFAARSSLAELALVDGVVGAVLAPGGRLVLAIRFEVEDGLITAYDVIADPDRLALVSLVLLDDG